MTPQARTIINEVATQHGVPFDVITRAGRVQRVFRARMDAANRINAQLGYSAPKIGRLLGCDHTMILYYLGRLKKKPSSQWRWRKPRVRRLYHVEDLLQQPEAKPPARRGLVPYAGFDPTERQVTRHNTEEQRA